MKAKKYLRLWGTILLLVIFGCQKTDTESYETDLESTVENIETVDPNVSAEIVDLSMIPGIVKDVKATAGKSRIAWQASNRGDSAFWLNEKQIVKVVDSVGNITYAIQIETVNASPTTVYNLIATERVDGVPIDPFVIRYEFENGDRFDYADQTDKNFDGDMDVFSLEAFSQETGLTAAGTEITAEVCYDDVGDPIGTTTTSSSGGSSGGGGSGGSYYTSYTNILVNFDGEAYMASTTPVVGYVEVGMGIWLPRSIVGEDMEEKSTDNPCPEGEMIIAVNSVYDQIFETLADNEKCAYDLLLTGTDSNLASAILKQFKGLKSGVDLNIKSSSAVSVDGESVNGKCTATMVNGELYNLTIEINSTKAAVAPILSVAKTVMHEIIHAGMFRALATNNVDVMGDDFKETYDIYSSEIFQANTQHNTMADLYINNMVSALKEIHQSAMPGDYNYLSNNGTKSLDDFYEALAWSGLKGDNVDAWNTLPADRQATLNAALAESYYASTKNCPN